MTTYKAIVLAWVLSGSISEAAIFWASSPVAPGETVVLAGAGLAETKQVVVARLPDGKIGEPLGTPPDKLPKGERMVVEITLFGNQYGDSQWAHSPLKASNNIQGIGNRWEDFQTLHDPALTLRQDQMVRKIVRELKNADNVIYEISNEPFNNRVEA